MIIHIAGPAITVDDQQRQRCAWCGEVLIDFNFSRVMVPVDQPGPPATWPAGELVAQGGNASWIVEHRDGDQPPAEACARLDPAVTRWARMEDMRVQLIQGMDATVRPDAWLANLGKTVPLTMPDGSEGQALIGSVTQAADGMVKVELDIDYNSDAAGAIRGGAGLVEMSTHPEPIAVREWYAEREEIEAFARWVAKRLTEAADPPTAQLDVIERTADLPHGSATVAGTYDRPEGDDHG